MNAYFASQSGSALNFSVASPARSSLISAISFENSGTNSTIPSGMIATPKLFPAFPLFSTESAICEAICERDIFLAATSSPIRQMLGCVSRAHSSATWLALLPITLMKCQYFLAEFASLSILPISSEYVLVAVSNPNEASISSFLRSPSIVFGHPIT